MQRLNIASFFTVPLLVGVEFVILLDVGVGRKSCVVGVGRNCMVVGL